jgi:hypothetical protein
MTTEQLDELRRLGEELRQLFADERDAIAKLDARRLEALVAAKRAVAARLASLPAVDRDPLVRDLFAAIRVEAQATAMLAASATEAVRTMLGYETAPTYDRRAKQTTLAPTTRILTTY